MSATIERMIDEFSAFKMLAQTGISEMEIALSEWCIDICAGVLILRVGAQHGS